MLNSVSLCVLLLLSLKTFKVICFFLQYYLPFCHVLSPHIIFKFWIVGLFMRVLKINTSMGHTSFEYGAAFYYSKQFVLPCTSLLNQFYDFSYEHSFVIFMVSHTRTHTPSSGSAEWNVCTSFKKLTKYTYQLHLHHRERCIDSGLGRQIDKSSPYHTTADPTNMLDLFSFSFTLELYFSVWSLVCFQWLNKYKYTVIEE